MERGADLQLSLFHRATYKNAKPDLTLTPDKLDYTFSMKQALNAMLRLLQNNNRLHEQIVWAPYVCMSLDKICISKRATDFHPSISLKQMESLLTIADNLEPLLRRINMWHRRKTKKLTLFNQIILRFKLEDLYSIKLL